YTHSSLDLIHSQNLITYHPQTKSIFTQNPNTNKKEPLITIPTAQNYTIPPNLTKYFSLTNPSHLPNTHFNSISPIPSLPSSTQITPLNLPNYNYTVNPKNAYHNTQQEL
ncbi:hypothetical protein, partial [Staphylococcus epidermidis]|uniref:hypothetical protein n=1 Tax=Staphylococcus epidermidis TaxID=1282 RepID=UPI001C92DBA1